MVGSVGGGVVFFGVVRFFAVVVSGDGVLKKLSMSNTLKERGTKNSPFVIVFQTPYIFEPQSFELERYV